MRVNMETDDAEVINESIPVNVEESENASVKLISNTKRRKKNCENVLQGVKPEAKSKGGKRKQQVDKENEGEQ